MCVSLYMYSPSYPTDNAIYRISFKSTMTKATTNVHTLILVLSSADFKVTFPQFKNDPGEALLKLCQLALKNCF